MIGAYDGWPSSTSTAGLQVRYTVQDVPISPWLSPSNWKYTITQDSPMLANFNDGVLDISLQVMGSNRMGFKPWPAFLHLKRNRPISPLVPVMVGDNPNSMGPRVPVVTRVARSERRATGEGRESRGLCPLFAGQQAATLVTSSHAVVQFGCDCTGVGCGCFYHLPLEGTPQHNLCGAGRRAGMWSTR